MHIHQDHDLLIAVYQAAADHLGIDFDHPRSLHLYFAGEEHRAAIPHVDIQQIEKIISAVCKILVPACEIFEKTCD